MRNYDREDKNDIIQRRKDRRALVWRSEEEEEQRLQTIQKKSSLEIADPNDKYEQEADAVADKVVNGGTNEIKSGSSFKINRSHLEKEEEESALMAKSESGGLQGTEQLQAKLDSSKGGGQSLDKNTKSEMESKMGADLGDVKIHTDSNAHEMSEGINAKAFTHGQDIYFKQGNYDTNSNEGKKLLAHELTHTKQQKEGVSLMVQRQKGEGRSPTFVAEIELFKFKVPGGEMEGKISLEGEKENPDAKDSSHWNGFKTEIKVSEVNKKIEGNIGLSIGGFESGAVDLFPGTGVRVNFDFKALTTELDKDGDFEFALLEVSGNVFGEITTLEQLAATPFNSPAAQELIKNGFKFKFGGTITYKLNDIAELRKLAQLRRLQRSLKKDTDLLKKEVNELNKVKKKKNEILEEEFKKLKEEKKGKKGWKDKKSIKELSKKQKKKLYSRVNKREGYKALKEQVNTITKKANKIGKRVKSLASKMDKVAKDMVTPLGKIAARIGLKGAFKVLSKFIPILNIITTLFDLWSLISNWGKPIGGGGDGDEQKDGEEGDETDDNNKEEGDPNAKKGDKNTLSDIEKEYDEFFEEFETIELDETDGEDDTKEDDNKKDKKDKQNKGNNKQDGKDIPDQSVPPEEVALLMETADEGQKAIFDQITKNKTEGLSLSRYFVEEFMVLPLAGLEKKKLERLLSWLMLTGKTLKTEEEMLDELQGLIDTIDEEFIESSQKQKEKEEEKKKNEQNPDNTNTSNDKNPVPLNDPNNTNNNDGGNKDKKKEKEPDYKGTAESIKDIPKGEISTDVATTFILLNKNVSDKQTNVDAMVTGKIVTTGETFKVTGLKVNIINVSKTGLITYELAYNYVCTINNSGKKFYYSKGAQGSTKK